MIRFSSPLRYPGGKAFLVPFLAKTIDKNNLENVTYVEPYAGGAGAALELLFSNKVSKIIINDYDKAIFSFWKVAVKNTDKLIKKIRATPVTVYEWRKQKKVYENKQSSEFDLAFATFFLNRTNRSGIIEGGPIGGLGQAGKWKINARFNKKDLIGRLEQIKKFSKKIKVTNQDGISLLNVLKKQKRQNLFIFLDPPYFRKGQLLYLNHYNEKDHKKLEKILQRSLLKWVMTYDDTLFTRELYSDKKIKTFPLYYSAHSSRMGKEILIHPGHVKVPKSVKR